MSIHGIKPLVIDSDDDFWIDFLKEELISQVKVEGDWSKHDYPECYTRRQIQKILYKFAEENHISSLKAHEFLNEE